MNKTNRRILGAIRADAADAGPAALLPGTSDWPVHGPGSYGGLHPHGTAVPGPRLLYHRRHRPRHRLLHGHHGMDSLLHLRLVLRQASLGLLRQRL